MKKIILAAVAVLGMIACNKPQQPTESSQAKTAYIDTSRLLKEYQQAKDIEAKYKAKEDQMSKELETELTKLEAEIEYVKKNAQSKGMEWFQQNAAALQEKEQRLMYVQQGLQQQLSSEYSKEADTLVKAIKQFVKDYGKEKGYDYIYGTNEASNTVLYAKDGQEITDEIVKLLNEKYNTTQPKEENSEITQEAKK
ncbi:MAG: OmpH family outer membrane protein [Flavobacteriaceae bacterium]